jgi:hypothetical protein
LVWDKDSIKKIQGNNLAVPQKVKHRIAVQDSNSTLKYITPKIKTMTQIKLCTHHVPGSVTSKEGRNPNV